MKLATTTGGLQEHRRARRQVDFLRERREISCLGPVEGRTSEPHFGELLDDGN